MNKIFGEIKNNQLISSTTKTILKDDKAYEVGWYGQLFNQEKLKKELLVLGIECNDEVEELLLNSYFTFKEDFVNHLEGHYVLLIKDEEKVLIVRDHLGIKPFFYKQEQDHIIFSTQIKDILANQEEVVLNQDGILELIGLGPSCTPGKTIYKDIVMLEPACYMIINEEGIKKHRYWKLTSKPHTDDFDTTVKKVREMVEESILSQAPKTGKIASMLSGGLDSSLITAVLKRNYEKVETYSVDYQENDIYFKPYEYQTTRDEVFIKAMIDKYHTNHHFVMLQQEDLVNNLEKAMTARDMPGMADIDSSLLLFLQEIKKDTDFVFSGECADELFGGYPWFYKEELYLKDGFPWQRSTDEKMQLVSDSLSSYDFKKYIHDAYQKTIDEVEYLDTDTTKDRLKRRIIYLNINWFMHTLVTRGESQCVATEMNVLMPFASHKILEYVWNIPYEYLFHNNQEKGLLREAFKDILPQEIWDRKKSPFPKTYSPLYTKMVCDLLIDSLKDDDNILFKLFNKKEIIKLIITNGASFKVPWFGQLMMGPQLLAYLYQIYIWGKVYKVQLKED